MVPAMQELIAGIYEESGAEAANVIFGCEAAAAEPFMENLPLNDLRFNQVLNFGTWAPAYAFVFHEYVNNFQGNQVETTEFLSTESGANHLLLRTAYSFSIGDLMTIVLTEEGEIHWGWCTRFSVPVPDQESIIALIRNLTAWRKGAGREFLIYGRMEKPFPLETGKVDVHRTHGDSMPFDEVLTSRFQYEGRDVQLLVNWQEQPREVALVLPVHLGAVSVMTDASGTKREVVAVEQRVTLEVPALNALLIEFSTH